MSLKLTEKEKEDICVFEQGKNKELCKTIIDHISCTILKSIKVLENKYSNPLLEPDILFTIRRLITSGKELTKGLKSVHG